MPIHTTGACPKLDDNDSHPPSVVGYLATTVPDGGRNRALYDAASQLRDADYTEQDASDILTAKATSDGLDPQEIENTIASAFKGKKREPARGTMSGHPRSRPTKTHRSPVPAPHPLPDAVELPEPMDDGFRLLLDAAYDEGERVFITGEVKFGRADQKETWSASGPKKHLRFIALNPMSGNERKSRDVTAFRHSLVEFDKGDKGSQFAALVESGFPFTAVVDSGHKSIHGWLTVSARNEAEYKRRTAIVKDYFSQFEGFDAACAGDAARLGRCPQGVRDEGQQELLALHIGAKSWEDWEQSVSLSGKSGLSDGETCRTQPFEVMDGGLSGLSGLSEEEKSKSPFPTHLLPDQVQQFVETVATCHSSDTPASLPAMAALGALSSSIGKGLRAMMLPGMPSGAALYIVGGGCSSCGKTEIFKRAFSGLMEIQAEEANEFQATEQPKINAKLELLQSRKKFLLRGKEQPNAEDELVSINVEMARLLCSSSRRLFVQDATPQAIVRVMGGVENQTLSSLADEARDPIKIVLGLHNRGKSDEGFLTQAWSGTPYQNDRVTDGYSAGIDQPCLNIMWFVQSDLMREISSTPELLHSGFLQRLLISDTGAKPVTPDASKLPHEMKQNWDTLLTSLYRTYRKHGEDQIVLPEEGASEIIRDYADENVALMRGDLRHIETIPGKWTENACRIAVNFHAAKHGANAHTKTVSVETTNQAVGVMRWFSDEMLSLVRSGESDQRFQRARKLHSIVEERYGSEGVPLGRLKDCHHFEADEVKQLCTDFPHLLRLDPVPPKPGGGRPTFRCVLV